MEDKRAGPDKEDLAKCFDLNLNLPPVAIQVQGINLCQEGGQAPTDRPLLLWVSLSFISPSVEAGRGGGLKPLVMGFQGQCTL